MTDTEKAFWDKQEESPNDTLVMLVFADWLTDQGREAEAECMRLLGQCGKVGGDAGYYWNRSYAPHSSLPNGLYDEALWPHNHAPDWARIVGDRKRLLKYWASIDQMRRQAWANEILQGVNATAGATST